jgi:hypothetical protein
MKPGFTPSMFQIEYGLHGMKTNLKSKTGPLRPEKVCWLFYGITTGSVLLQCLSREFHAMYDGSSIDNWSHWLRNSFRLGGVQGEKTGSVH